MDAPDHAGLNPALQGLFIDIQGGLVVLHEHALVDEGLQVLARPGVDPWIVGIDLGREVDLGPPDPQETQRIPGGVGSGFGAVDDVIGWSSDLGGEPRSGAPGAQGIEADGVLLRVSGRQQLDSPAS
jgi:hypothetical protein